jgi:DNA uptake protein ComE-like DNA-binding protein
MKILNIRGVAMDVQDIRKQIGRTVGEYLTYNRTEQRGILVLCLILLMTVIANGVIPSGTFHNAPDFSSFSKEIHDFNSAWQKAADSDSMARLLKYHHKLNNYSTIYNDSNKYRENHSKPLIMVELNAADTFDLQQLRGIGPGFARRIVNYRERLRGFTRKSQVLEVYGMDTSRYRLIEKNLLVNPDSVHRIDLNTVTFKELLRHPYFPFAITKNIMLYRQKNKSFKTLDELLKIEGINDSIFRRMFVYLRLGP